MLRPIFLLSDATSMISTGKKDSESLWTVSIPTTEKKSVSQNRLTSLEHLRTIIYYMSVNIYIFIYSLTDYFVSC